jgi:hypothetical protein
MSNSKQLHFSNSIARNAFELEIAVLSDRAVKELKNQIFRFSVFFPKLKMLLLWFQKKNTKK